MRRAKSRRGRWIAAAVLAISAVATTARAQAPGPELFAREPRTPVELWEAADYLVRTGQAAKAVPYLDRFLKAEPDDATMIAVRDRFGLGSFLRLDAEPATKPFARPLADRLAAAARRYASRPGEIDRLIRELLLSPAEREFALRRLWEAGPYAVPPMLAALRQPGLSAGDRALIVGAMGRLQTSAVAPLAAALDSPEPAVASAAANALGAIGRPSSIPFLTFSAASSTVDPSVRSSARAAIEAITGTPLDPTPGASVRTLVDAAWAYHRAVSETPDEPVVLWTWDAARRTPTPHEMTPADWRTALGQHFADLALRLDSKNAPAIAARVSLILAAAVRRVSPDAVATREPAAFAAATAAGRPILTSVVETAIADRKTDLAAAALIALAKITDKSALAGTPRHPDILVAALTKPGRRLQFAAARAIVELAPDRPFPGAGQVAETLGRFLADGGRPRAVVIDHNPSRGAMVASALAGLGYFAELEGNGRLGFLAAAGSADVELVLVAYDLHQGWLLTDTLANLKADARTTTLPLYVYGPYDYRYKHPNLAEDFPGMRFLVPSSEPAVIEGQLGGRPSMLTEAERIAYAREAAALLARIAATPRSPLASGLRTIEPTLAAALRSPEAAGSAAVVLATLPNPDGIRALADAVLDPSRPAAFRTEAARRLADALRRFGPLLTRDQEARLVATIDTESETAVRKALGEVVVALRIKQ